MYYGKYLESISENLIGLVCTDLEGNELGNENGFDCWVQMTKESVENNKHVYFIGNGASSMMAGHMSADAMKNGELRSMTLNETAAMTALSNDISYEEVFSFQLDRFANEGDYLFAISSSGNSQNIVNAIQVARIKGMKVVTISGIKPDNKIRQMGDLNLYVPAPTYGVVEVCHQAILHIWLDKYLDEYKGGRI